VILAHFNEIYFTRDEINYFLTIITDQKYVKFKRLINSCFVCLLYFMALFIYILLALLLKPYTSNIERDCYKYKHFMKLIERMFCFKLYNLNIT